MTKKVCKEKNVFLSLKRGGGARTICRFKGEGVRRRRRGWCGVLDGGIDTLLQTLHVYYVQDHKVGSCSTQHFNQQVNLKFIKIYFF